MNYWEGLMDWPIQKDWICEICNTPSYLIWGIVHAHCRCDVCHTEYHMRDEEGTRVTTPIQCLKKEYIEPAKIGWKIYQKPLTEWTDEMWDKAIEEAKK